MKNLKLMEGNMSKRLVILVVIILITNGLFAVGIKGGLNVSNFFGEDTEDMSPIAGIMVGFYSPIGSKSFIDFQSELLFVTRGSTEEYEFEYDDIDFSIKYQLSYIEIPVLLKVQIPGWIRPNVYAGPYGAILLSSQVVQEMSWGGETEEETTDIYEDTNVFDWGFVLGAGIDLGKINIDARYNVGCTDVFKKMELYEEEYQLDAKNASFTLSVGVTF